MATVTLWLLIAASNGPNTSASNIAQFATEADCLAAAARLERLSRDKTRMAYLYSVCVESKVVNK